MDVYRGLYDAMIQSTAVRQSLEVSVITVCLKYYVL